MQLLRRFPTRPYRPTSGPSFGACSWGIWLLALLNLLAPAAHAQRPVLHLDLRGATSTLVDQAFVYVQAGASLEFDAAFDATKLSNSSGLNLATLTPLGQRTSIKGLPPSVLTAPYTLGLFVGIPRDDIYSLQLGQLDNFGAANVYLADAETQTRLLLTQGTTYTFPLGAATTGGTFTTTRFSLVFEPADPLPVTLVAFTAERRGPDGLLQWATAAEQHHAYFQVESSLDGTSFTALGQVAGAGTSTQLHQYQFVDANLARYASAVVYYRLREVATDGTSTYSPVRVLPGLPAAGLLVQAYPNPITSTLALTLDTQQAGAATLVLTDALGRVVRQQQLYLLPGHTAVSWENAEQLARGLYLLRVQQGAQQQTLRLVRP